MISQGEAVRIAAENFPRGPEFLARHLGVPVVISPLRGVDGWCVRGTRTVIRVNSTSSSFRQRFTLAHELAHLILGTRPDIVAEPFRSDSAEERAADRLASEMLIPIEEMHRYLRGQLPLDARTLERIAKAAIVSPVTVACRVVHSTHELGLANAAVVFFQGQKEQWRYSQGLSFARTEAEQLLEAAIAAKPEPIREKNRDGNVVVCSVIDALTVYQVLLIQLLPPETAALETREERLATLGQSIFGTDYSFQQSVAACLGTVKSKCQGQSLEQAIRYFNERYLGTKYTDSREIALRSSGGIDYVRLYLERWFD